MTPPEQHGAGCTAWASRLETYWFTCERIDPVGTTVRYTVRLHDAARPVVGEIAWSSRHNSYAVTLRPWSWQLVAQCLHDLGEICTFLTARSRVAARERQRRQKAGRRPGI